MPDLRSLFEFSSIAVIGASESSGHGSGPWEALREVGFEGRYFPINPRREQVHGFKAYPAVTDVPEEVQAAVIAVPRDAVLPALQGCADKGVRAVTIVSSGFAEADDTGRALQAQISKLARERNIVVVGPNCFGAASLVERTAAFGGAGLGGARPGNVAVISNSGGLLNEVVSYGSARGIGFAHLIASGNEAGISSADALDYFAGDPATEVVLGIVEAVRDPVLFVAAAERAAAARKPIVLLKLGVSEKGARSALTHTGALAGSEAVYDALFRQKGIIRVRDIDELVEMGALLSGAVKVLRQRQLERVAIIEISGGGTELLCDTATAAGVPLPEPSAHTARALDESGLEEHMTPGNPLDTAGSWGQPKMAELFPLALRSFATQDDVDVVVARYTIPRSGSLGSLTPRTEELLAARAAHPDRLFAVLSRTSDQFNEEWGQVLRDTSLTFLQGYGRGMWALGRLGWYSRWLASHVILRPLAEGPSADAPERSFASLRMTLPAAGGTLNEVHAKDLLREAGLPVVPTTWAHKLDEAMKAAAGFGYPVAAKVISPEIVHKSDAGGVKLGLATLEALAEAFNELQRLAGFEGAAIQPMAKPGIAELALGAHRDPVFGPVVLFGLGGIFVETLKDVALRVAPLAEIDADEMLDEIRAAPLLQGARGQVPADRQAIVHALQTLAELMLAEPRISSIDCNPAFAYADGLLIVDARIVVE